VAAGSSQQSISLPSLGAAQISRDPGFTKWALDSTDVTQLVDALLKGATFEPSSDDPSKLVATVPKADEDGNIPGQLLNPFGRKKVISLLSALSHKGVFLSNLNGEKIARHVKNLHKKMALELLHNWKEIGVDSPRDIPKIAYMVSVNVDASMRRAMPGKGGGTWVGVTQLHQVHELRKESERGGMFSFLKRGGSE